MIEREKASREREGTDASRIRSASLPAGSCWKDGVSQCPRLAQRARICRLVIAGQKGASVK